MPTTTGTRWTTLLAAGTLSLSLAACGGSDDADGGSTAGSEDGAVGTAATTQDTAGTSADTQAATGDGEGDEGGSAAAPADGEEVPVEDFLAMLRSPGEEDMSSYELDMVVTTGGQTMEMAGEVDLGDGQPSVDADLTMPGLGATRMIVVDGSAYVSMPGVTDEGMFLEVPQGELEDSGAGLDDIDVASTWEDWDEGAGQVVYAGLEDVDGEELRRYEIVVDVQAVLDASGQTGSDAAEASAALGDEITYDVWVDEDDLVRRISYTAAGAVTEMTIDRWGEPMDIEAPDPEDVQPMPTGGSGG